jgi:hypothetical protein
MPVLTSLPGALSATTSFPDGPAFGPRPEITIGQRRLN